MARDNGQGMFTMAFINQMATVKDIGEMKRQVLQHVQASPATPTNKTRAIAAINAANTTNKVLLAMSNFSLSHQGMKVIR